MKIVERLLNHPVFRAAVAIIEHNEQTRVFCRHGMNHALDVARISTLLALENSLSFDKETIYLAALLHDLGRSVDNAHHDEESARLALRLLPECGATSEQAATIAEAIGAHREKEAHIDLAKASLGELLAYADHKSRPCYRCAAAKDCYWDDTLKNHTIIY